MSMSLRLVTASVAAGALLFGLGALSNGSGSARAVHRSPRATAQARAALTDGNYAPGVRALRHPVARPNAVTDAFYYNWSGYAATGGTGAFSKVSGSWMVSRLTSCTGEHTTVSEWVGVDGFSNPTVEQAGTLSECFLGKPSYIDWYEMYPTQPVVTFEHNVSPGDKINASVTRRGATYTLVVIDTTHRRDSFTTTARCTTCQNDSAEWINERNIFALNGYSPLSDYGTWKLTNGAATKRARPLSIGALPGVNNITMIDATGTYNLSTASALTRSNTFTTTWRDSW
jgi:hypothetical protein